MPRSRATEISQGLSSLRTSSSESDPIRRSRTARSPKLADGQSPRASQSDPVIQKKLGTRISDLESQLGQAQKELKCLKNQLASAEAAKRTAQEQLEKKSKRKQNSTSVESQELINKKDSTVDQYEPTDVFEVPIDELALRNDEIRFLQSKLDEKETELDVLNQECNKLKSELNDKSLKIASAESEIEELALRLKNKDQELETSKMNAIQIGRKLEESVRVKEELENEMKKLRIQTEQWRKAADAAAAVLSEGVEINDGRISERCGSMDKHFGEAYGGFVGEIEDDGLGSGKRKGPGIRMFGDLWKKKGHKY